MANNIAVSVTADVADLTAKRAIMSAELRAATQDLNTFAKSARTSGMTDELRASMLASADTVAKFKAQIGSLDQEMKKLSLSEAEVAEAGGLKKLSEGVEGALAPINEVRTALAGITEAFAAAFAVERIAEFANQMGEVAEKTLHTAETFGLTVAEVQKMNAQAALFGVPADAMTTAMQRLDKSFATAKQGGSQQAAAFKEVGISLTGAYTQTELMNAALEGLSKMDAGPAKVAAAMAIFGRNIQEIGPLLSVNSEQIEEANGLIEQYGVVNEASAAKGIALAESLNQNKLAGQGLGNVMTDALAPAFKSIVDGLDQVIAASIASYEAGGMIKTIMDFVGLVTKAAADTIGLFGAVAVYTFDTVDGACLALAGIIVSVGEAVIGALKTMVDAFKTFGDVARDALTLNWDAIAGDIRSGAVRVSADVVATAKKMGAAAAEGFKQGGDEWMAGDKAVAGYEAWSKKLWSGAGSTAALPKEGAGTTSTDPPKAPKGARAESPMTAYENELRQSEYDTRASTGAWLADMTDFEVQFWEKKLATAKSGSQLYGEIQKQLETAMLASQRQAGQQVLADDKEQIEAKKNNWAQEEGALQKYLADAKRLYGEQAPAFKEVQKQVEAAERQHDATMVQIQRASSQEQLSELKSNLDTQKQLRQQAANSAIALLEEQAKSSANPLADVRALQQEAQIHQQTLQRELLDEQAYHAQADLLMQDEVNAAKAQYGEKSLEHTKALNQMHLADLQYANQQKLLQGQMAATAEQDAQKVKQAWHNAIDPMVQSFGDGIKQMVEGQETLTQAALNFGETVLDVVIKKIEEWAAAQIVAAVTGGAATKTAAVSQIASNVALAGSGGVASMAAAPFPLDLGAPAFGAAMAESAAALGALGGFAKGMDVVPNDMVALIHAGERIVPRADNSAMISALGGGGGGSRSGDTHFNFTNHYSPTVNGGPGGIEDMLRRDKSGFVRAFGQILRDGSLNDALKKAGLK